VSLDALLHRLSALDVRLSAQDGALKVSAPPGVLTPALKAELSANKPALLARLAADADAPAPLPRTGPLPAAPVQRRLWFLDRLEGNPAHYNQMLALELQGPLDRAALRDGFAALLARHETLRTGFVPDAAGLLMQHIAPAPPLPWVEAAVAADDLDAALALARQQAAAPFDLAQAPLMRLLLVAMGPQRHLMVVVLHHMVSDGWSTAVLQQELSALYAARLTGGADPLPPLPVQYADLAAWQERRLAGPRGALLARYWADRLAGAPLLLDLPSDRPPPAERRHHYGTLPVNLPAPVAAALAAQARRLNATPFLLLLAAWGWFMGYLAGQEEVVVGTPVAGRDRAEARGLIGFLVNTLPLRLAVPAGESLSGLVAALTVPVLEDLAHQDLPFERIVEAVNPPRRPSHPPLHQVMLNLHTEPSAPLSLPGLTVIPRDGATSSGQFLALALGPAADGGLSGTLEYDADLFAAETAAGLSAAFTTLLAAALDSPSMPLAGLPKLPAAMAPRLAAWGIGPQRPRDGRTAVDLIRRQAARTPDAVALRWQGRSIRYGTLLANATRVARDLRARGIGRGDRVGLCLERGPGLLAGLLGVMLSGAAYVPMDPLFPADRLRLMAEDAAPAALLCDDTTPGFPGLAPLPVRFDPALGAADPAGADLPGPETADTAYVIYTSGSTGRPKGVAVGHAALANLLLAMAEKPGLTADDRLLAVTTISFDIAGLELLLPLCVGATVVLAGPGDVVDGARLARLIAEEAVTTLQATPASWRLLLAAGWQGRPGFRMLCGGEALPAALARALLPCGTLWNVYGPTETTIWSAAARVETVPADGGPVPIAGPIDNTTLEVVDAHGRPVGIGVPGELWIGGDGLAQGYHNRPDLTRDRFRDDVPGGRRYRTGDRVRWQGDGTLRFLGRMDHQVKLRGVRIELGEIESLLLKRDDIAQAVCVVRQDDGEDRLVAYAVPRPGRTPDAEAVRQALRATLPAAMVPDHVVLLDALPLTPNRKVDRAALPAPVAASAPAAAGTGPLTETEARVAALWGRVLGRGGIGAEVNFFDLGGHSLRLVAVQAGLEEDFGLRFEIAELFRHPTVRSLAAAIAAKRAAAAGGGEDGNGREEAAAETGTRQRADRRAATYRSFQGKGRGTSGNG